VGGIQANAAFPADFIRENLLIETSVIEAAHRAGVRRLIFFGSTCLYPRVCRQPMKEESIQTGPMEPTSEAYSVAKLAGLAMCEAYNRQHGTEFITLIPATLYGPNDSFDLEGAHVLTALMRRFHEARGRSESVTLWGTGRPVREFLYVDDLAEACLRLLRREEPPPASPINVGSGQGLTICDLARQIAAVVGFEGRIDFDPTRPDGAPEKVLDSSRMRALGWQARTSLREGLAATYAWFRTNAC
jgi:GDP-L-fucose synthase